MMFTFHKGGIHPPENKLTAGFPPQELEVPPELRIMLSQSIGKPSKPIVKPNDKVEIGMMIAEATGFVSAPIHSPVNGIVKKLEPSRNAQGRWEDSIVIEVDSNDPFHYNIKGRSSKEIEDLSAQEIVRIIGDAGIVGLGGATFPTRVKLTVPEGKKISTVIINGAECEPFLTCDDMLMRIYPEEIMKGAELIMKATGAKECLIGIENNKKEAYGSMKEAAKKFPNIRIALLKTKYPQGSEKQLIFALTNKKVPAGGLPIDTECVVDNVATAFSIFNAVYRNIPLFERYMTVTGPEYKSPGNYLIKNGTPLSYIFDMTGGLPESTGKIIAGGPMMGRAVSSLEASATKGLSGLVVFPESISLRKPLHPCIRCAACIEACPMGLEPYLYMLQAENKMWDDMLSHGVMNCLECGCCSYTCPSQRPLLDMIRLGKATLRNNKK